MTIEGEKEHFFERENKVINAASRVAPVVSGGIILLWY